MRMSDGDVVLGVNLKAADRLGCNSQRLLSSRSSDIQVRISLFPSVASDSYSWWQDAVVCLCSTFCDAFQRVVKSTYLSYRCIPVSWNPSDLSVPLCTKISQVFSITPYPLRVARKLESIPAYCGATVHTPMVRIRVARWPNTQEGRKKLEYPDENLHTACTVRTCIPHTERHLGWSEDRAQDSLLTPGFRNT